jgi:hypothetical protein
MILGDGSLGYFTGKRARATAEQDSPISHAPIRPDPGQAAALHLATGWYQIPLLVLTVAVSLIEVVPLELQTRIVNDAVKHRAFHLIIVLCAVYAGVALAHGLPKLLLNVYRGWVAEYVTRDLRKRVRELEVGSDPNPMSEERGIEISMIVAESEPIGLFVAGALSEPLLQGGILATVLPYMIHIDLWMTLIAAAIFVPQFIFVPLMQSAINRRTKAGISILRILSASLTDPEQAMEDSLEKDEARIVKLFGLSMGAFKLKYAMNFTDELRDPSADHRRSALSQLSGAELRPRDRRRRRLHLRSRTADRSLERSGDLLPRPQPGHVKYRLLATTTKQIAERHGVNGKSEMAELPRQEGDGFGRPSQN